MKNLVEPFDPDHYNPQATLVENLMFGTPATAIDKLRRYRDLGVTEFGMFDFAVPACIAAVVLQLLEQFLGDQFAAVRPEVQELVVSFAIGDCPGVESLFAALTKHRCAACPTGNKSKTFRATGVEPVT